MPRPRPTSSSDEPLLFTTSDLGFTTLFDQVGEGSEPIAWAKAIQGETIAFRFLRRLGELVPAEGLQREVMGATDLDIMSAGELVVVYETGGDVIGAFGNHNGVEELLGVSIGFGGYVRRRPRLVSDLLAVRSDARSRGLGGEIKKLQAAVAIERGFVEMVWTVDPLRAANARLNFEKLGATASDYEINRYGEEYGTGLYGGLPSDRLHVTWDLTNRSIRDRLLGKIPFSTIHDFERLTHFNPDGANADRCYVLIPSNIDLLVCRDFNAAYRWRLTLREALPKAFAKGFAITGFVPDVDVERGYAAYLLTKCDSSNTERN